MRHRPTTHAGARDDLRDLIHDTTLAEMSWFAASSPAVAVTKPELISTGDAAQACGVSTQTIVNWIRGGRLRAATTGGGRYRVHVDSLVEFLRENQFEIPAALRPRGRTIYVIDDEPAWLAAVKRQLGSLATVETFPDGYRGLVAVVARVPDLLVLDMKMPGLDGAGVLAALRGEGSTRDLPILVVTSFEEEAALARRYGATMAVLKGSTGLRTTVEKLIG